MAMGQLVYPGAVHTRFHHSLGAYHLMGNAVNELRSKGTEITEEEVMAILTKGVKTRQESAKQYSNANRQDLADIELEEISFVLLLFA